MGNAPGRLSRSLTAAGTVAAMVVAAVPAAEGGHGASGDDGPVRMRVEMVAGTSGVGYSGDGGRALDAQFESQLRIDVDAGGNIYVADTANGRLRVIDAEGTIETVPGAPTAPTVESLRNAPAGPDNRPYAVAVGDGGDLYVAASHDVRRRDAAGAFHLAAGEGARDSGTGEPAVGDGAYRPMDMALDSAGNVYLTDEQNDRVRKIDTAGVITTVAGGGDLPREAAEGGPGTAARVHRPRDVAVDRAGNVYFTEADAPTVRRVAADGTITTVVGAGPEGYAGDGGPAAEAQLSGILRGLAVGDDGTLFIADRGHGHIRRVDPDGTIATVPAAVPDVGDIAVAPDGVLYAATYVFHGPRIMRIAERGEAAAPGTTAPSRGGSTDEAGVPAWASEEPGTVVPVAGVARDTGTDTAGEAAAAAEVAGEEDAGDGAGAAASDDGQPALEAELDPSGIAVDADGDLYVGEWGSSLDGGRIHRVDPTGTISAVRVGPTGVRLGPVVALAPAPDGSLYVASGFVGRRDADGLMTVVVAGGTGVSSTIEADGSVADDLAAIAAPVVSTEVAVGPEGQLYVADDNAVYVVEGDGTVRLLAAGNRTDDGAVRGIAVDPAGNVYVARDRVLRVTPDGEAEVIAGSGSLNRDDDLGDGGPATEALLSPTDVAVDAAGTVYVGEHTGRIRRIAADGTIDTIAEALGVSRSPTDENAEVAGEGPTSLAVDGDGNLFAATPHTSQVQVIVRAADVPGPDSGGGLLTVPRVLAAMALVALATFAVLRRDRLAPLLRRRTHGAA